MQRLFPFFSFNGRSNRQRYWVTNITIFMLSFVASLVSIGLMELPKIGLVGVALLVGVGATAFAAALANGARRLHDRAKSAWWLLLFMVLPWLLSIPATALKAGTGEGAQAAGAALSLLGLPFSIWGFVVMACLKGTAGPNSFGEDPLAPVEQAPVA